MSNNTLKSSMFSYIHPALQGNYVKNELSNFLSIYKFVAY